MQWCRWLNNGHCPFCLQLCDKKQQSAIRAQIPSIWTKGSFCPLWFLQSVCTLFQKHVHSFLSWSRGGRWVLLLYKELKLIKINCNLPFNPSPGSCKPSIDSRVPKELHQTESSGAIVVHVGREIPSATYSTVFPESSGRDGVMVVDF